MLPDNAFDNVEFSDRVEREVHKHEVFMSFHNDSDALAFSQWWADEAAVLFHKYLNKRKKGSK